MRTHQHPSFYRVYDRGSEINADRYSQLGYAISVISAASSKKRRSIQFVNTILQPALEHRQIQVLFNEDSTPVGYVVWAYLAVDVEDRILGQHKLDLHFSEWNEGSSLWIIDFSVRPGHIKYALRYMRDVLFANVARVRYLRELKTSTRIVEIDRNSLLGCLRSTPEMSSLCRCGKARCNLALTQPCVIF